MPPKLRELEAELRAAGFTQTEAKGSHRKYKRGNVQISVSGQPGDDAKRYQEEQVAAALKRSKDG